jgi:DNA invertase Pin-like site-specific DNA recombinase
LKRRTKSGDPTVAIGYCRVSTDEQQLGPIAQKDAMQAWATARGVRLVVIHEDLGVSGGAELDRCPGLLAALGAVQDHGAGLLLVAKRDRLARDVVKAAMVESLAKRAGARVVSADGVGDGDDPAAQLLRTMVDAFAQNERAMTRSRVRAALAVKKARGERVGNVPYGYRVAMDGKMLGAVLDGAL